MTATVTLVDKLIPLGFEPAWEGSDKTADIHLYQDGKEYEKNRFRAYDSYGNFVLKKGYNKLFSSYSQDDFIQKVEKFLKEKETEGYTRNFTPSPRNILEVEKPNEVVTDEDAMDEVEMEEEQKVSNYPYTPVSQNPFSLKVFMPLSMAFETQYALQELVKIYGDVDEFVRNRLHYATKQDLWAALAAEQVDAMALAIHQFESGKGGEKGQALIVGDQTGVGKGRVNAACIRYGAMNGLPTVFFTENPSLFSDMYRDLKDIGSEDLVPFVINAKDKQERKTLLIDKSIEIPVEATEEELLQNQLWYIKKDDRYKEKERKEIDKILKASNGKLPKGYDFLMTTYSQFNRDYEGKMKSLAKTKKGEALSKAQSKYKKNKSQEVRSEFFRQFSRNAILVQDEAHNGAGLASTTGQFMQDITKNAQGVLFSSATYAKRPENMGLFVMKTAVRDAEIDFSDSDALFEKGGIVLQELVATELVRAGQMIRRQRPYEGIKVEYLTLDDPIVSTKHISQYNSVIQVINEMIAFENEFITPIIQEKKKGGFNIVADPLFNKVSRMTAQLLFSLKAEAVADEAIKLLEQNEKVVIAFGDTNETILKELKVGIGEPIEDYSYSAVLQRMLNRTLRYSEKNNVIEKDEKGGDFTKEVVEFFTINIEELDSAAKVEYESISEAIYNIGQELGTMSISPIDDVIHFIESTPRKSGLGGTPSNFYRVRECTGRKQRIQIIDGVPIFSKNKIDKNAFFNEFNRGDADVLLINASAATGFSAHASVTFADQRRRNMLIYQPELDINKEVQKWGRINRTGQVPFLGADYVLGKTAKGGLILRTTYIQKEAPNTHDATLTDGFWIDTSTEEQPVRHYVNGKWEVHPTAKENLPRYKYITTVIPTEIRALMVLKLKLKSLDANTTGSQRSNEEQLQVEDFFNKYGREVIKNLLKSEDGLRFKDFIKGDNPKVTSATSQISLATVEVQEEFYALLNDMYIGKINELKQEKRYDLEIENLDYQAELIKSNVYAKTTKKGNSVFSAPAISGYYKVKVLQKPFSFSQIKRKINQRLKKLTPEEEQEFLLGEYDRFVEMRMANHKADYLRKYEKDKRTYIENINNLRSKLAKAELELKSETENKARQATLQVNLDRIKGKIETVVSDQEKVFEDYYKILVTDKSTEQKAKYDKVRVQLAALKIGMPVAFSVGSENERNKVNAKKYRGIILDITYNQKSKSAAFTKSNISVKIALASKEKQLKTSFSRDPKAIEEMVDSATDMSAKDREELLRDWNSLIPTNNFTYRHIITGNVLKGLYDLLSIEYTDDGKSVSKSDTKFRLIKFTDSKGDAHVGLEVGEEMTKEEVDSVKSVSVVPINSKEFLDVVWKHLEYGDEFKVSEKVILTNKQWSFKIGEEFLKKFTLTVPKSQDYKDIWADSQLIRMTDARKGFQSSGVGAFFGYFNDIKKVLNRLYELRKYKVQLNDVAETETPDMMMDEPKGEYRYETDNYQPNKRPQNNLAKVDGQEGGYAVLTYEYPIAPALRFEYQLRPIYDSLDKIFEIWHNALTEKQIGVLKQVIQQISNFSTDKVINRLGLFITQNQHEVGLPIYVFGKWKIADLAKLLHEKYIGKITKTVQLHPRIKEADNILMLMENWLKEVS